MVLLDALYINKSGGKVLLDYLIESFETNSVDCYYLLDDRLLDEYAQLKNNRVEYMRASLLKRHFFYKKNANRFSKILCFGNLPPSVKCKGEVFTFFHQSLYLKIPNNIDLRQRITLNLKSRVLQALIKNTDYFLVQTLTIKQGLIKKFELDESKVRILPFFPELPFADPSIIKEDNSFIYVSTGAPHKNHPRLLHAFDKFYERHKKGTLVVTIPETFEKLLEQIKELQDKGVPIKNIGYVSHQELSQRYAAAKFMIFPSLAECLPLGLVECLQFDVKVLAADLGYTYEVCEPSVKFDPLDSNAILEALESTLTNDLPQTKPNVSNQITKIIELMQTA